MTADGRCLRRKRHTAIAIRQPANRTNAPSESVGTTGDAVTVNGTPLLSSPPTVTTTLPVVAPAGTIAVILVLLQLVTEVTGVPLNVTVLVLLVAPKLPPAIATDVPTGPELGVRLVMKGAG